MELIELYRGAWEPGTQRSGALMLDLGLAAETATVLWFSVSLQIVFYSRLR